MDELLTVTYPHRIRWTVGVLDPSNPTLAELMEGQEDEPGRVLVFVDQGVLDGWPGLGDQVQGYFRALGGRLRLAGAVWPMPGGEVCKNDWKVVERVCRSIHDAGLCRRSSVVAIGGGAVLDAVGFAAALCHRGVRLVRLPTTTLSQADSGVGVKNGVNAFGVKNFLGTFSPPWAVIHDERFLASLSDPDWISGFSEVVKVGLVKDRTLFEQVARRVEAIRKRDMSVAGPVLRRSAELHVRHIVDGGDPFETAHARPLDFGHWAAHKLEQVSGFRLRHGEAVAMGIALDVTYCMEVGLLAPEVGERIKGCLSGLGLRLFDEAMGEHERLLEGLDEFAHHLGRPLCVTLLRGIGQPVEVYTIDRDRMRAAIDRLSQAAAVV